MARLFVYGTLLVPIISERVLGRPLVGIPAVLKDHVRLCVEGEVYPAVVRRVGSSVEGRLCDGLDRADLDRLDAYEGDLYRRVPVRVECRGSAIPGAHDDANRGSLHCETYLFRSESGAKLTGDEWSLEEFQRCHSQRFSQRWH